MPGVTGGGAGRAVGAGGAGLGATGFCCAMATVETAASAAINTLFRIVRSP